MPRLLLPPATRENTSPSKISKQENNIAVSGKLVGAQPNASNVSEDEPCSGAPTNCVVLEEVTVTAAQAASLVRVGGGNNPKGVREVFISREFKNVVNLLPADIKEDLQSGRYAIRLNYNGDRKINFCVGTELPVTRENQSYTVEFTKR